MPTPVRVPVSRSVRALVVLLGLGWGASGWGETICNGLYCDEDGDGYFSMYSVQISLDKDETCKDGVTRLNLDCQDVKGDDCADGDEADHGINGYFINPGYSSVDLSSVDAFDNDCDGYCLCYIDADDDGDGALSGASWAVVAESLDGACPCGDADNSSFTMGDCDDYNASVNSKVEAENCELVGPQVDEDCDGDPNTHAVGGWDSVIGGTIQVYPDSDNDGYGGIWVTEKPEVTEKPKVYVCAIPAAGSGISAVSGDCNDYNPFISPGAAESCNDKDDNCNSLFDEPMPSGDSWVGPIGHVEYYMDADKDGQGLRDLRPDTDPDKTRGIGLCPGDLTPEDKSNRFNFVFCGEEDQPCCGAEEPCNDEEVLVINKLKELKLDYSAGESVDAWLADNNSDCSDLDPEIYRSGERGEINDGRDTNCKDYVALAELDCDGDEYYSGEVGAPPRWFSGVYCEEGQLWPTSAGIKCEMDTVVVPECVKSGRGHIWMVSTMAEGHASLFRLDEYGQRGVRETSPTEGYDCDDTRAEIHPDASEKCDGFDNNCNKTWPCNAYHASIGACLGEVCEEESDPDCDGYITCTLDGFIYEGLSECDWVMEPRGTCDSIPEQFGSGDTWGYCSLSVPLLGPEEDLTCDGILPPDRDHAHPNERDEDGDTHLACGPSSPEAILKGDEESVYFLAYFPKASQASGSVDTDDTTSDTATKKASECTNEDALPLLLPRAVEYLVADTALMSAKPSTKRSIVEADLMLQEHLKAALVSQGYDYSNDELLAPVRDGRTFDEGHDTRDPLFDLCVRAELAWLDNKPGRCAVIELKLTGQGFQDEPKYTESETEPLEDSGARPMFGAEATRLVWSQERILESRRRVVEWDCFITFGTYGCGHLEDEGHSLEGFPAAIHGGERRRDEITDNALYCLEDDPTWWQEIGRFRSSDTSTEAEVLSRYDDNLLSCWGDPTADDDLGNSVSPRVGGDCSDGEGAAHRDALEGPYDLRSHFIDEIASCDTCVDGLDNNCDGLTDCEDPGCAPCFVGQGSGCAGAAEDSPCASSGGCSAGRGGRAPGLAALGALLLSAITLAFRRKEAR